MNNRTAQPGPSGTAPAREVDLVDQLPAELPDPRSEQPSPYLGRSRPARRSVVMFLLPRPSWTYTPVAMENMTRLDIHKRPRQEVLTILVPKPGWRHEVVTMASMTRLEIIKTDVY